MCNKFNVKICNYNGVEIAINESILSNNFVTTVCSTMKKHSLEKYINNIFIRIVYYDDDFEYYRIDTTIIYTDNTVKTFECGYIVGNYFFDCFECECDLIYKLIKNIR